MLKQLVHRIFLLKVLTNLVRVLGVSSLIASLIALPAYSQSHLNHRKHHRIHRTTPRQTRITPDFREFDPAGKATGNVSGIVTYPYGSRVYTNGTVQTPNNQVIPPAATINHGNGSTSYYYPDGSRIDTNRSTIPAVGTFIK